MPNRTMTRDQLVLLMRLLTQIQVAGELAMQLMDDLADVVGDDEHAELSTTDSDNDGHDRGYVDTSGASGSPRADADTDVVEYEVVHC